MKLFQTLVITGVFAGASFGQVSPVADQLFPAFRSALNTSLGTAVATTGSYTNPAWLVSIPVSKVTGISATAPITYTSGAFACSAATGSVAGCLSAADWTTFNAKGSSAAYTAVSFSATPAFTVTSNTVSGFALTLTGNVTSSTISGATAGQVVGFSICQDATGSRTLVWPVSFVGAGTVSATASACTQQSFQYDGTNYQARGPAYITGGAGGSITLPGSTSGTTVVQPTAAASGTLTLPAATDTLVGKATTDTLTNKTFDTAGTGNSFSINGVAATANTGTGAVVRAVSPALTTPDLGTPTALTLTSATGLPTAGLVNNAVTSAKMAVVNARRVCSMVIGADNGSALADADIGPQGRQCFIPAAATVVEVEVAADAGTPNVIARKNHAGTGSNFTSAALATAASGGIACSNTGGTTGIDGATTCSSTLQNTSLAAGDWVELISGTAGGTAKRMSVDVVYTVN